MLMASISKTVHDYLRLHTADQTTQEGYMACPFSVRRKPKEIGDFDFNNDFSIVPINMRFISDFKTGLP